MVAFIPFCNEPYLDSNSTSENIENNQNFSTKEGVLNFSLKDALLNLYDAIKEQGAESFLNKKIKIEQIRNSSH
jgi:hypothetical protein